jgi:D-lactate dehydrogenase (cytochrome)/glycolate oxidase
VEQIERLLAWANEEVVPIYPRGRATNVVGGCVPERGGLVLSLLHLKQILEINGQDFLAVVEPGVVTADLQQAVQERGLFYPPDPASSNMSTIGGNVATNAGGLRAVKYGVTGDFVLGLEAVLPGGKTLKFGARTHKDVVGLDLTSLLVGSEGTLAVVTKAWLKLLPAPSSTASILALFPDLKTALEGGHGVLQAGILPVALEMMDGEVLEAVLASCPSSGLSQAGAAILVQVDGDQTSVLEQSCLVSQTLAALGGSQIRSGLGAEEEESIWQARRSISQASYSVAADKWSMDVTLPRGAIGDYVHKVKEVGRQEGLDILTFGHLGDGNIHTNIMYDKQSKDQTAAVERCVRAIMDCVLTLRGSLSGEHGVGTVKRPFIGQQIGAVQQGLMRQLKAVFDPKGILNPGKGY